MKVPQVHQIDCVERLHANTNACLQLRSTLAAEESVTQTRYGEHISEISACLSLLTLFALIATVLQSRIALWRVRVADQQRLHANISVKGLNFEWKLHLKAGQRMLYLWADMENSGETPTRNLKFVVSSCASENDDIFKVISRPNEKSERSSLGPRQIVRTPSLIISESDIQKTFRGEAELFLAGAAFYDDVFLIPRETRFMCRVQFSKSIDSEFPDSINWQFVGSHNCADEECSIVRATAH